MRKVILGLAVSLDGYIEGPKGEFDWCFTDQDYGMADFLKSIDAIFYGRKSYEMMMRMTTEQPNVEVPEVNPFASKKSYVFSNTLNKAYEGTELVTGNLVKEVLRMKNGKGKNIWLFGGANLVTSFLNEGLIDEIGLAVHPIILGAGKLLFQQINGRKHFTLMDSKTYSTGLVYLTYQIDNGKIT